MVHINTDCINIEAAPGACGGSMCICPKCTEERENSNKADKKLKPCPFCGGRAVLIFDFHKLQNVTDGETWEKTKIWWIKCDDCQVSQWRHSSRYAAISAWNKRLSSKKKTEDLPNSLTKTLLNSTKDMPYGG